jgi:hypothetical protein
MNENADTSRTRSPAYPAITLENAIAKSRQLYAAEDHRFANIEAVASHWEMGIKSSGFQVSIAALKQFGLITDEGSKENRKIKLTELALDILEHPTDSEKFKEAVKAAALFPKIHRELWEKYESKMPTDVSARIYLVREREGGRFNKNYVDAFIAQYKETMAFAKLDGLDILPPADKNQWGMSAPRGMEEAMKTKIDEKTNPVEKKEPLPAMRELPITLPTNLEIAVFRVPVPMSELDFKTIITSLTAMKDKLVSPDK